MSLIIKNMIWDVLQLRTHTGLSANVIFPCYRMLPT